MPEDRSQESGASLREQIDDRLRYIGDLTAQIAAVEAEFEQRVADIREQYQQKLDRPKETLAAQEKVLIAYLKQNKSELFNKVEKVTLPHGIVIYTKEPQLKLPKNAVEAIEKLGWNEAIKIAKSVDREMVEKWPIEKIVAIGGDKKPKEKFEYELIEVKGLRKKEKNTNEKEEK